MYLQCNDDFESFSFDEFKQAFLLEKSLDKTSPLRLGELSKSLSKINISAANELNRWTANISSKVGRYVDKLKKRYGVSDIVIRKIPTGDIKTEAASIIVLNIGQEEVQVSIFDSNKISIKMSNGIANLVNKGKVRKFLSNKDKVADYLIGILEVSYDI